MRATATAFVVVGGTRHVDETGTGDPACGAPADDGNAERSRWAWLRPREPRDGWRDCLFCAMAATGVDA